MTNEYTRIKRDLDFALDAKNGIAHQLALCEEAETEDKASFQERLDNGQRRIDKLQAQKLAALELVNALKEEHRQEKTEAATELAQIVEAKDKCSADLEVANATKDQCKLDKVELTNQLEAAKTNLEQKIAELHAFNDPHGTYSAELTGLRDKLHQSQKGNGVFPP